MSNRGVKRSRRGGRSDNRGAEPVAVDENNPVIKQFLIYQRQLDTRHDKHERIVKLSRDITIESKRAIFLLHRISRKSPNKEEVLSEVEQKLQEIQEKKWRVLAEELVSEDPHQFLRAYSPGLQEYIEALSFFHFLKDSSIISAADVGKTLCFERNDKMLVDEAAGDDGKTEETMEEMAQTVSQMAVDCQDKSDTISVHIPPLEYILGIADLTGELMRMAIQSVGVGDIDFTFELCRVIRSFHDSFIMFGFVSRDLSHKLSTLKQSLKKVEAACYALQIRGSEIPKHMLVDVLSSVTVDNHNEDHCVDT